MKLETPQERQLAREKAQLEAGIAKYREAVETKDICDLTPGKVLLKRAVEPVAKAITAMVEAVEAGKAGRGRPARSTRYLQHFQSEAVAYLTARTCLSAAAENAKTAKTAMALAAAIEDQFQFDELRVAERNLANSMERKAKKWSTAHHRLAIMRLGVKVAGVRGLEWSNHDKLALGMKLIELFVETTGLAEQAMTREGYSNSYYYLRPTAATAEWLQRMHERMELLEPERTPMVCPPKPWTNPVSGGYLTPENRVDFISGSSAEMRDDVFSLDMPDVYRAVNAVQATAWKINKSVYNVLRTAWENGDQIGGLPAQDWLPVPERPTHIPADVNYHDLPAELRDELDAWRRQAAEVHAENAAMISKRLAITAKLSMAMDVLEEPAIYFPHNFDFRGRIYSVVAHLNPQADDLGKALLHFSEGKPLGENGAFWLHVHIANAFGVDKVSFEERVQWVQKHSELLLDSAFNPLDGRRFWTQADKKSTWCALAACFEYAGWMLEGNDYVSHLPIAMDGSCSGLQHFSAMLRDAEGGAAVNLVPQEKPADIYTEVAKATEAMLAESTEQLAISWRGKVSRKIVKRPCMTFAYSVTSRGMRDQILDEIKKQAGGKEYLPGWENYEAASFLAPIVETAIRQTVKRASAAMDWLKAAVKQVVNHDVPAVWYTPDGFPVQHRYVKQNGQKFEVWFGGLRMRIQLRVDTTKQCPRKHQSAIAPNYVHSMDATHLRMVVNRMQDEGITQHFAVIHDSFGTYACDVDDLNAVIREEFINLYSVNRLEEFRQQMLELLPEEEHGEVPSTPLPGTLDLSGVRDADFFFA